MHFESSWPILEEEMRDVVLEGIRGASRSPNTGSMESSTAVVV